MKNKKRGLGSGLDALFGNLGELDISDVENVVTYKEDGSLNEGVMEVDIEKIEPNPGQPRKIFDELPLRELAESIKIHGIIQPILITPRPGSDGFIIIAGERRYRAAKMAGLERVPVISKTFSERQKKEIALIENLQREDLNPMEEAQAIASLISEYNLSQEEVAVALGKSRPAVTNSLRLLNLEPEVQNAIYAGRLSAGHGRALASVKNREVQLSYANAAQDKKMSVRELELMVNAYMNPAKKPEAISKIKPKTPLELRGLVDMMQKTFGTKVMAVGNEKKGRIYMDYYTSDDLDRIYELISALDND